MAGRLALVVATDADFRHRVASCLTAAGYEVLLASTVEESLQRESLQRSEGGFLFTILDMACVTPEARHCLRSHRAALGPLVSVTEGAHGEPRTDPEVAGTDHVLHKPFTVDELERAVRRALGRTQVGSERQPDENPRVRLHREIALWKSVRMQEVRQIIEQAARVDVTVLVSGETGTGKEIVARAIHDASGRQSGAFVKMNCAAVPRELLESELFGHERGAFTGAHQLKMGKFESADRGTIFLDEIADLHPALQGKLLHVLQDGSFSRVGGRSTVKVDVRVVAATNQDLEQAVAAGRFREDLYYRLNVIQIVVPPLRERTEEIPTLAEYFLHRYSTLFRREHFRLPPETMSRLMRHRFPGNVRELENMIKRMIVLGDPLLRRSPLPGSMEAGEDVGPRRSPAKATVVSLKDISRRAAHLAEREAILEALEQTQWNRVRAAKLLEISYRALLYKIKDGDLNRERRGSH